MKNNIPERIDITAEEADNLIQRINSSNLLDKDKKLVTGIVNFCLWLQVKITTAKITIRKLKKFFGIQSEKRTKNNDNINDKSGLPSQNGIIEDQLSSINTSDNMQNSNVKKQGKNKGHIPASHYTGATEIQIKHDSLSNGSPCPLPLCSGKLYNIEPGSFLRIIGGKMAEAKHYIVEKLRCNLCNYLFSAPLPNDMGKDKYDARFKATLAVHKYFLGLPFHRMERMQSYLGVPLPDSTQWHLISQLYPVMYVVFCCLEHHAAQGTAIFLDDTKVKIISVMLATQKDPELKRKGTFTTAIISKIDEYKIYLFYSSRKHAGENATELLKKRNQDLTHILYMCDALSSNIPKELEIILLNCLSHARREFIDLEEYFPEECAFVIKQMAIIYKNDKYCKEQQLSDAERLVYHQRHSKPVMNELKDWSEKQMQHGLVEPNSGLGKAINYMLKRWDKFTRFYEISGAALDNNCTEEVLKIPIRVRKNSSFFATESGAAAASILTSLIVTSARAGINPVEYLTALQEYEAFVAKSPKDWLPWNYAASISKLQSISVAA